MCQSFNKHHIHLKLHLEVSPRNIKHPSWSYHQVTFEFLSSAPDSFQLLSILSLMVYPSLTLNWTSFHYSKIHHLKMARILSFG